MKNRFVAAFIALTLGTFGINEFYTNNKTRGVWEVIFSVLFCWTIIAPLVVTIINFVRAYQYIWCDTDQEFNEKYVYGYNNKINLND